MEHIYLGKSCPYCKTPFKTGDTVVFCSACDMPHHLTCWQANGGCTTFGCTGSIGETINPVNEDKNGGTAIVNGSSGTAQDKKSSAGSRFVTLYEQAESRLQDDTEILTEKVSLIKDQTDDSIFVRCNFRSLTDKPIKALLLNVNAVDVWGKNVQGIEGFQLLDLKTKREAVFGQTTPIPLPDKNSRQVDVIIKKILYEDGSMVDCEETFTTIASQKTLADFFGDKNMAEQYARETYSSSQYVPSIGEKIWRCSCGAINKDYYDVCYKCKAEKELLLKALDPEKIRTDTTAYLEEKRIKEENDRREREERQREAEERLRKAQEEKERQDRERLAAKKARKKKIITRTVAAIVIILSLAGAIYGTGWHLIPYIRYTNAGKNVENYMFDEAYKTYSSLGTYKDSASKAVETVYKKGEYLISQKKYTEAALEFDRVANYQDSGSKAEYCRNEAKYLDAMDKYNNKEFDAAKTSFTELGSYSDSSEWVNKTIYAHAQDCFEREEYSNAHDLFVSIENYEDARARAIESIYMTAEVAFSNKDYDNAYSIYDSLGRDYKDCVDKKNESMYLSAETCFDKKDYEEAVKRYNSILFYKDSKEKANESLYLFACTCMEGQKYKEASDSFFNNKLRGYKDSDEKLKESSYLYALNCYNDKFYSDAVIYFARVPGYEDADSLLKDAKYERALQCINIKSYKDAVDLLSDLGKYKESKTKINEAKYGYVKAHKNNTDKTTYSYLKDLKAANYSDAKDIYKELYKWQVTLVAVNDDGNNYTKKATYVDKKGYCHFYFKLTGGPPGEKITMKHTVIWPSGSKSSANWYWEDYMSGDTFGCEWSNGLGYTGYGGTLTIKVYNKATGDYLGEGSVSIW